MIGLCSSRRTLFTKGVWGVRKLFVILRSMFSISFAGMRALACGCLKSAPEPVRMCVKTARNSTAHTFFLKIPVCFLKNKQDCPSVRIFIWRVRFAAPLCVYSVHKFEVDVFKTLPL